MRVFRRHDIAGRARGRRGRAMRRSRCDVVHVDLYFFFDVDVVLLNVEVGADDLSLAQAQEHPLPLRPRLPGRLGRAGRGAALHEQRRMAGAPTAACWRAPMRSSAKPSSRTWPSTARRASRRTGPALMQPLVSDHSDEAGALRFRQIEYYRMPVMAYLALDDPRAPHAQRLHPARRSSPAPPSRASADPCPTPRSTWPTSSSATATTASGSTPARRPTRATCATATR